MSIEARPEQESSGPTFSKDDRLEPRAYEQLYRGALSLDGEFGLQAEFAILMAGRLGMRAGEITHMTEEWVDWRSGMINVPRHEECDNGRGGGPCGHCRQLARQMADVRTEQRLDEIYARDLDVLEPGNLVTPEVFVDAAPIAAEMWQPKTEAAARAVPFRHSPRVELCMERFFERYDGWPVSQTGVNRRVNRAATAAMEVTPGDVYPHCLRATAACYHAGRGVNALMLQALMGWADLSTAQHYVRISGEAVRNSLEAAHR